MEKKIVLVIISAAFLGLLSAALSFAAEAKRIKASNVHLTADGSCLYPTSPALVLGSTAVLVLIIAQAIINTAAGCFCCKKQSQSSGSKRTVSLICFILSWITFIMAFMLLLTGAALNDKHGLEATYLGDSCYVVKPGVFAGGAVLSLATVILGISYYVLLSDSKSTGPWSNQHSQGIMLAQPQIPVQSTPPVFVHEDTYNRRLVP